MALVPRNVTQHCNGHITRVINKRSWVWLLGIHSTFRWRLSASWSQTHVPRSTVWYWPITQEGNGGSGGK